MTHAHLGAFCFLECVMVKQFKTIEEQLNILRSRGLKIEDETIAAQFLLENNYYRKSILL